MSTTTANKLDSKKIDLLQNMEFALIEGGSFEMGDLHRQGHDDEKPVHRVEVDDFWLARCLVTQQQWQDVMGNNPSHFREHDQAAWWRRDIKKLVAKPEPKSDFPVEQVSWQDTQRFIKKVNQQSSEWHYCLPTEAQWEYAAAGGGRKVFFGTGGNKIDTTVANFNGIDAHQKKADLPGKQYRKETTPVKHFRPNQLGLYDMSGNLWEWCEDWDMATFYQQAAATKRNPCCEDPASGMRALRGGSWYDFARNLRVSRRNRNRPIYRNYAIGFRLSRVSKQFYWTVIRDMKGKKA